MFLAGVHPAYCKAYVLVPNADRRKNWEVKARVGYFIGYSRTKSGYRVLLGDTVVIISVHAIHDVSIPEKSAHYFKVLEEVTVKVDPDKCRVIILIG